MMTTRNFKLARAALHLFSFIFAFLAYRDAAGLDCGNAVTPVERKICADPVLKRLDRDLERNYLAVKKYMVADVVSQLVASQRVWVAQRDRECRAGDKACIAEKYQQRNEVLLALLARTSEENPVIDPANPAVMSGAWIVSDKTDPPLPPNLTPLTGRLPHPGARVKARLGELCVVEPPIQRICWDFGLAVVPEAPGGKKGMSAAPGSTSLLGYLGGKADFELLLGSNRELAAVFDACEPRLKNCRQFRQRWLPASPDAEVRVLRIFGD